MKSLLFKWWSEKRTSCQLFSCPVCNRNRASEEWITWYPDFKKLAIQMFPIFRSSIFRSPLYFGFFTHLVVARRPELVLSQVKCFHRSLSVSVWLLSTPLFKFWNCSRFFYILSKGRTPRTFIPCLSTDLTDAKSAILAKDTSGSSPLTGKTLRALEVTLQSLKR